jgi:deoxycytidylate deaminase
VQCSLAIIQAGLAEVITFESAATGDEHWQRSTELARSLFDEAGVRYRMIAGSVRSAT